MFYLAKEFGWTPDQIKNMTYKDHQAMVHILSVYNKVSNNEAKNAGKGQN